MTRTDAATLAEKLECVERELRRRLDEYPKLTVRRKMYATDALWETRVMRDIVRDYQAAVERDPHGAGLLL